MRRIVFASLLVGLASVVGAGAARAQEPRCEPEKVAQKYPAYANKTVKIAASASYPPYSYSNPNDLENLTGFDVETVQAVMACAGLKFEFLKGPWPGLLSALFSGSADVMIGNVNYRADRAEKADFVLFTRDGQSVVVQKGNPKKIVEISDLCGNSGSASIGGTSALEIERQSKACVERGKPAIDFRPGADNEAGYRQLSVGRIDFEMDNSTSAARRLVTNPEFEVALTLMSGIPSGFVVTKGNEVMLQIVDDSLKVLARNGTITALLTKHGLSPDLLIPVEIRR